MNDLKIMCFPIKIIKDGELHHAWKEQSKKAGFSMEFYILQALKEKIERDK